MPDQYGRFTLQDGLGIAGFLQGLKRQQTNNQIMGWQRQDRERAENDRNQINKGFGLMLANPNPETPLTRPDDIEPINWGKGLGLATDYFAKQGEMTKTAQGKKVQDKEKVFHKALSDNGWDFNSIQPQTLEEMQALSNLATRRRESQEGQRQLFSQRVRDFQSYYPKFRASVNRAGELTKTGHLDEAANGLVEMSKVMPSLYTLENRGDGQMAIRYLSSKKNGRADVEVLPVGQVVQRLQGMGPKGTFTFVAASNEAVNSFNAEQWANPIPLKGKDGKTYRAVVQKKNNGSTGLDYFLYDENNKFLGTITGHKELMGQGFIPQQTGSYRPIETMVNGQRQIGAFDSKTGTLKGTGLQAPPKRDHRSVSDYTSRMKAILAMYSGNMQRTPAEELEYQAEKGSSKAQADLKELRELDAAQGALLRGPSPQQPGVNLRANAALMSSDMMPSDYR